jgi:hypothetical protein
VHRGASVGLLTFGAPRSLRFRRHPDPRLRAALDAHWSPVGSSDVCRLRVGCRRTPSGSVRRRIDYSAIDRCRGLSRFICLRMHGAGHGAFTDRSGSGSGSDQDRPGLLIRRPLIEGTPRPNRSRAGCPLPLGLRPMRSERDPPKAAAAARPNPSGPTYSFLNVASNVSDREFRRAGPRPPIQSRIRACRCHPPHSPLRLLQQAFPAHHFIITRLGPEMALLPLLTSGKRNSELTDVRSRYERFG